MILAVLFIIGWIACGFLAYGACLGDFARYGSPYPYDLAALVGILGPFGLVVTLVATIATNGSPFARGFVWRPGR